MPSFSLLLLVTLLLLTCLSKATSPPHNSPPPPPPPPSKPKPNTRHSPPPPPPPPPSKHKSNTRHSPPPPPPPPPPPKGVSPIPPPPFTPPCKCSVSLKTLGACALVLRGIAVGFAERVCCKGLRKLSYSDVSSCICFVFRTNVGKSSKLKVTVEEAKKVIRAACNL